MRVLGVVCQGVSRLLSRFSHGDDVPRRLLGANLNLSVFNPDVNLQVLVDLDCSATLWQ